MYNEGMCRKGPFDGIGQGRKNGYLKKMVWSA